MEFEEAYSIYSPKIFRLCLSYTNDNDWAKDLTQETFIQVWKNFSKFRNESDIGTWIFRISTNICLRQIEKASKVLKAEMPMQLEDTVGESNNEQIDFLHKCIATLEETERLIISLVLEDLPYKEIANIIGISEGNVRTKIHRIKQVLIQKFSEYEKL